MVTRRPLRVCHLAYTFYEFDNRVTRYVQALAERGDAIDVITLRRPGTSWRERSKGVEFYRIQRRSTNERAAWTYLLKLVWFCLKSALLIAGLQLRRRYDGFGRRHGIRSRIGFRRLDTRRFLGHVPCQPPLPHASGGSASAQPLRSAQPQYYRGRRSCLC